MKRLALRWPTIAPAAADRPLPPWWRRLSWMVAIWALSIGVLGAVAVLLRLLLKT